MIPFEKIEKAREAVAKQAVRTPLVRLNVPESEREIFLKLENLQPIHSFKLRGALALFDSLESESLRQGVVTASAGNWAQGACWVARQLEISCTVIVPDSAPQTKLDAITRLGGKTIPVPFSTWWQTMLDRRYEGVDGIFLHPVEHEALMAGNGTIGLELLEDLPELDTILIPWGGGGLTTGIASAVRQKKPDAKIFAVEVDTAAPLAASLAAGRPVKVDRVKTFVDGIGSERLLENMWPHAQELLDGSFTASVSEVADAVRTLVERNRIIAEGAGATPVAVALNRDIPRGKTVCIISGGNLDMNVLKRIVSGEVLK